MNPKPNNSHQINELMSAFFAQARAQFGAAIKSYWFYAGDLCPGCSRVTDGVMKFKGQNALSLNTYIYRERGVLIGYLLCKSCAKTIHTAAQKNPYRQTPLHTQIEQFLSAAYLHQIRKQDAH
jgi:hypothetical protein